MQDREHTDDGPAYVYRRLHYVGPNHCRQTAFERVNECERGNDCDGGDFASTQRNRHHDRYGIDAHAFSCSAREQEQAGS